ncbi:MAG: hypothetical protein IPH18_07815 [Chitinophagaceae bacterium]|nr:hypothetical protein [Chitinophagaceae bacterium]
MQKIILPAFAILFFSPLTQFAQTGLQTATQAKGSLVGSGQKFIVETTLKTNTAAEVMGQTMETNIDVKTSTNYDVKNAGSESADLQKTVSKLVVSASMMGQELQYDSDKQDNPAQMEEIFSGMVNKPLNLSIDGKGNITKQQEMLQATNPLMMAAGAGAATTTELFVPDLTGKEFVAGDSIKSFLVNTGEKNSSKDSGTYKITIVENGVASISYSGIQQTTGVIEQNGNGNEHHRQ